MNTRKTNNQKNHILLSLVGALAIVAGLFIFTDTFSFEGDQESPTATVQESTEVSRDESIARQKEESQPDTTTETAEPVSTEPEDKPTASTNITVDAAPVIFTGFGHSSDRPLPIDQQTSTSCTTDPGVDCIITFTNSDTSETLSFTITTNDQGVGLLTWVGGQDVTSGTWSISATAGDQTSETEIIYVQ